MPEIVCPCGATVTARKTPKGWETELGSSYTRYCPELHAELKAKGTVGGDFNCKLLDDLVAQAMQRY